MMFVKGFNNPQDAVNQLCQTNPQFRKFLEDNKGLSNEQIAQKYGIKF